MPAEQSEAVILRTFAFGEQDKLAVFFTRDKGVLRGVAKGARKFANRFGSSLEPMSLVKVFYHEKERRDLVTVTGADLQESFFDMQKDPDTACILCYFAELVEEFSPSRAKDDLLFRLLLSVLRAAKSGGDGGFLTLYFETWILRINGFLPDLSRCKACGKRPESGRLSAGRDGVFCGDCAPRSTESVDGGITEIVRWILKNPPPGDVPPDFPPGRREGLRRTLRLLIAFHLEREPRAWRYLKA